MNMISKQEVQHIAKLARLGLKAKELDKMQKELSAILDYMEQLKEVDVSKVEPTTHSVHLENIMREDKAGKDLPDRAKKLIDVASEKEKRFVKVKSILS